MVDSSLCKLVAVLRRHVPIKHVASMYAARYVLQKYTKSWGWMPPMPHFLFGVRNILNGDGVVDGCEWHSLLYKVCVFGWGGVGDCLPNDVPRAMAARFFLTFMAKQNWIWKAIGAT